MFDVEVGVRDFPLWLVGSAEPREWPTAPSSPLGPRYPAWHDLSTPLFQVIEDITCARASRRLDRSSIYLSNALPAAASRPSATARQWDIVSERAVADMRRMIELHRPVILLCFGGFAFEFARRAVGEMDQHNYGYWNARRLGDEFRARLVNFEPGEQNLIPLLERRLSVARFIESYEFFCGRRGASYFEFVGRTVAETLLQFRNQLPIWMQ